VWGGRRRATWSCGVRMSCGALSRSRRLHRRRQQGPRRCCPSMRWVLWPLAGSVARLAVVAAVVGWGSWPRNGCPAALEMTCRAINTAAVARFSSRRVAGRCTSSGGGSGGEFAYRGQRAKSWGSMVKHACCGDPNPNLRSSFRPTHGRCSSRLACDRKHQHLVALGSLRNGIVRPGAVGPARTPTIAGHDTRPSIARRFVSEQNSTASTRALTCTCAHIHHPHAAWPDSAGSHGWPASAMVHARNKEICTRRRIGTSPRVVSQRP
jgi:hypothetical protein